MHACRSTLEDPTGRKDLKPRPVRIQPAEQRALPRVVTVSGTLAAEQQVDLGMKTAGRLEEIHVDLGSKVRKGQPLARLAPIDFELRVRQAQAGLQQARARLGLEPGAADGVPNLDRTSLVRQAAAVLEESRISLARARELSKKQLMPRSQLDAAEAEHKVAEGKYQDAREEAVNRQAVVEQRRTELELAQQQLLDSVLLAPFDGAVSARLATPGQFVSAGQPVVTLVQTDPLRLRMDVPEREAAGVRAEQEVRLRVTGDETVYRGKVARLSPAIDEKTRTLAVEAEVPNPDGRLRPGAFATAEIVTTADLPAVFVPASAVVNFAGIEKVLLVKEDKALEKRVRTGRRDAGRVEVVEGLAAGEAVVVEPGNLVGGQPVTVER